MDALDRLASVLPDYERRPEQIALAEAVARALADEEHLLAQAGTGTGKSLGYLLPALESGRRVVVATATKALQEQLLTKDIPLAAAALGREVRVAVLKGRQNYLCRRRVDGVQFTGPGLLGAAGDVDAYERLLPWIDSTATGDRAELDAEPSASLWSELAVGSDRCLGRRCAHVSSCFAEVARQRAGAAELVIANHALYFADLALREQTDGARVLPEHDAVIFDEAHKLEESAATWLGARITVAAVRRLVADAFQAADEAEIAVPVRATERIEIAVEGLLRAVAPPSGRRRIRELPHDLAAVLIEELVGLAETVRGRGDELDAVAARAGKLAGDVEACLETSRPDRVVWAEPGALAYAPVDVSQALRDSLWSDGPTAVLVSATLEFGFVQRRLGLEHAARFDAGSPFDFRSQALLYVPRRVAEPREESVPAEVEALCRHSRGRALVLTTSYRMLNEIAAHLRGRLPYDVLVQGEEPRERLLDRFRTETDSVLVATATFWQGIDVAGEALSLLVIDKLPFPSPGDPLVEARCELIVERGGDWFRDYALPVATLQLRQGFGRLIRGHGDRGVVAILDPRIYTRGYGRSLVEALPSCPLVDDRLEVERFFAEDEAALGTARRAAV
ncbi:MAG: ATP-dependent helicase DinG [Gaiellaceae bacterium]|jgi:ATP-dependent DNA helicase DinG|nr:ATP-dependent helicase DinG [Gaiellaceae bacterium]